MEIFSGGVLGLGHVAETLRHELRFALLIAAGVLVIGRTAAVGRARHLGPAVDLVSAATPAVEDGSYQPGAHGRVGERKAHWACDSPCVNKRPRLLTE
jgi:hypothetical protein